MKLGTKTGMSPNIGAGWGGISVFCMSAGGEFGRSKAECCILLVYP